MKKLFLILIVYEILAIVLSWVVAPLLRQYFFPTIPPKFDLYFSSYGPMLAAFLVILLQRDRKFASKYIKSFLNFSFSPFWILAAFLPLIALLLATMVNYFLIGEMPQMSMLNIFDDFGAIGFIPGTVILIATTGIGEELGWRGFLLPKLQERFASFYATLIIIILWGIWHIPLFLNYPGFDLIGGLGIWIIGLVVSAFILTWLYNGTRNPFIPAIYHGVLDAVFNTHVTHTNITFIIVIILLGWLLLLFLLRYRKPNRR